MPAAPTSPSRALVVAALGGALALAGLAGAPTSQAREPGSCTGTGGSVPLAQAIDDSGEIAAVRAASGLDRSTLRHLAEDGTARADACGGVFVIDHAVPAAQQVAADPAAGTTVPDDVFALSSRPSSPRTLYLDFDGDTRTGTAWAGGATIASPPYSVDDDTSSFSDVEQAQIYLAWRSVAEDYAPFDVNVTTQVPSADALTRTSTADPTYGMPVVITSTNQVGAGCGCGGKAYVGVFATVRNAAYQPGWVFTDGSGTGGYNVGQVISHEAGHTFGLSHDGTATAGYYTGANGWGPIMGASYNRRASQWSQGEYAGASTTEDDVAIISRIAPTVPDDHGATAATATPLTAGVAVSGLVTSRSDADAFGFTAAGPTTVAVTGPPGVSDLDVLLTVLDAQGQLVATVDPTAPSATDASLDATWTADLPAAPARYTAVVDGTSHGDPAAPGGYSDYGSLGAYTVTLTTSGDPVALTPPPTSPPTTSAPTTAPSPTTTPVTPPTGGRAAPVTFLTTRLPAARTGARYRAEIAFSGPVVEARVGWRLPRGLRWRVRGSRVVLTGRLEGTRTRRVTVQLSGEDGSTLRHRFRIRVR